MSNKIKIKKVPLALYVPEELKLKLEVLATTNRRSVTAQATVIFEAFFDQTEQLKTKQQKKDKN